MKRGELAAVMFVLAVMLVGVVSASGVSAPYWEGNPLKMYKGETTMVNLNLQNMVGNEDLTYSVEIKEGAIASLSGGVYIVKAQTSDTMVPLRVSVPSDAEIGDITKVKVEFKTITSGTGGMVSMGTGMTVSFDVIVVEKPAGQLSTAWIVAIIAAIIIVVWMIFAARKKKKK